MVNSMAVLTLLSLEKEGMMPKPMAAWLFAGFVSSRLASHKAKGLIYYDLKGVSSGQIKIDNAPFIC
jgi:hypothetical protein